MQTDIDATEFVVDEYTYRMLKLDPWIALDISNDLIQIAAPTLGAVGAYAATEKGDALTKLMDGEAGEDKLDPAIFQTGITDTLQRMDKSKVKELVHILSKVTFVSKDGQDVKLDGISIVHFKGRVGHIYKFLAAGLKVQFEDVFTSLGPVIAQFAEIAARA